MTHDDIIRMAREAGNGDEEWLILVKHLFKHFPEEFERFAALVAAAERNKVAQWMIDHSYATGHGDTTEDLLKELEWQVRDACAKVAEAYEPRCDTCPSGVANAIRARGQA